MNNLRVDITAREIIKPSSPTPHSHKFFKLSFLDQIMPHDFYVPTIFYYAANGTEAEIKTEECTRIDRLKKSLSQALTHFYPLAGRVVKKENLFIECTDEGVDFLEAKVNCPLSEILRKPEVKLLDQFLPHDYHISTISSTEELLQVAVQVNIFSCGGVAVGTCLTHKIVGGATFSSFINLWTAISRGSSNVLPPIFLGSHLLPPKPGLFPSFDVPKANCITKRFVFDGSKIASLKEIAATTSDIVRPTRIEVLTALIWKCAMDVNRAKSGHRNTPSVMIHSVNLRPINDPPLPKCAAGNLAWLAIAPVPVARPIELRDLVNQTRNAIKKFDEDYVKKMQGENGFSVMSDSFKQIEEVVSENGEVYRFVSWATFQLYEADFGWGKPVWVSTGGMEYKNVIIFIETKVGNGIEAWITMEEQDMAIFESNEELRSFASLDLTTVT